MLIYLETNLLSSPAQTLVNTVNTVGIMGKGIAKQFKETFPEMFKEYKIICDSKKFDIGNLHLWRGRNKWVLNFPTKTTWKLPSKLSYVEEGLVKFVNTYEKLGITSVSFPRLGCGNGQLNWENDVRPLMEKHLGKLPIDVFIHTFQGIENFIPEHKEYEMPITPDEFFSDIKNVLFEHKGIFHTNKSNFSAFFDANEDKLVIEANNKKDDILKETLISAWSTLQEGILSQDQFGNSSSTENTQYLFPILAELPYVQVTKFFNSRNNTPRIALLLKTNNKKNSSQTNLW